MPFMYVLPNVPSITYAGQKYYQLACASHCYINTLGAVLSTGARPPAFLKQQDNNGYQQVSVKLNAGSRGLLYVHRLVAERFIPNPEGKSDVNHLDGNKANNDVCNLAWCTKSENTRHAYATGLMKAKRGPEHHRYGKTHSTETKTKLSAAKLGENHPKFSGWYVTPAGSFPSAQSAAGALGTYAKKVDRWCKSGQHKAEGYDFLLAKDQSQELAQAA
jgi:hypothetical protein